MKKFSEIILVMLAIILVLVSFLFLHKFFTFARSNLGIEILAGVIGALITVSAMAILLRFQAQQEKKKEFEKKIVELKLMLYKELIEAIFQTYDDDFVEKEEVQKIEHIAGVAFLVAGENAQRAIRDFVWQLKAYGCMYPDKLDKNQIKHFIKYIKMNDFYSNDGELSAEEITFENYKEWFVSLGELINDLREDLEVLRGEIDEEDEPLAREFFDTPYNAFNLIRIPPKVE